MGADANHARAAAADGRRGAVEPRPRVQAGGTPGEGAARGAHSAEAAEGAAVQRAGEDARDGRGEAEAQRAQAEGEARRDSAEADRGPRRAEEVVEEKESEA